MREDLSEIVALRRCIQRRNSQVALILALVLISLSACLMPQTSRAHVGNQTHMQPGHSEHQIGRFFERNSEHIHEPLLSVRSLTSRTLRGGGLTGKPVTDSLRGDSLIGRERTGRVLAYRGGAAGVANSSSADARGRGDEGTDDEEQGDIDEAINDVYEGGPGEGSRSVSMEESTADKQEDRDEDEQMNQANEHVDVQDAAGERLETQGVASNLSDEEIPTGAIPDENDIGDEFNDEDLEYGSKYEEDQGGSDDDVAVESDEVMVEDDEAPVENEEGSEGGGEEGGDELEDNATYGTVGGELEGEVELVEGDEGDGNLGKSATHKNKKLEIEIPEDAESLKFANSSRRRKRLQGDVIVGEYTIHLHKLTYRYMTNRRKWQDQTKEAMEGIRQFARRTFGLQDVRIDQGVNEFVWHKGKKHHPLRVRVRLEKIKMEPGLYKYKPIEKINMRNELLAQGLRDRQMLLEDLKHGDHAIHKAIESDPSKRNLFRKVAEMPNPKYAKEHWYTKVTFLHVNDFHGLQNEVRRGKEPRTHVASKKLVSK